MDYEELRFALEKYLNEEGSFYQEVQNKIVDLPNDYKDMIKIHFLSKPIEKVLKEMEFYDSPGGWFIKGYNSQIGFHPNMVADKLVSIFLKNRSSTASVDWFDKIIHTKSADGYCVMLLWGVGLNHSIDLCDGIQLVPLSKLPQSKHKDWACDDDNWSSMEMHSRLLGKPECAIIKKITIEPFIVHSSDEFFKKKKESLKDYLKLDEIGLILSVVGPSPTRQAVEWFNFEDEDLDYAQYHGGKGWQYYDITPSELSTSAKFDPDIAKNVVSAFYEIKEKKTKDRIINSIKRLNQAMMRSHPGDCAVELSIAFECLFADNYGENTYKIGLRVALLIGESLVTKTRIRSIISSLYTARSSVVHNGKASSTLKIKGHGKHSLHDVVKEGYQICAAAISKIVLMKTIPDWYDIELN